MTKKLTLERIYFKKPDNLPQIMRVRVHSKVSQFDLLKEFKGEGYSFVEYTNSDILTEEVIIQLYNSPSGRLNFEVLQQETCTKKSMDQYQTEAQRTIASPNAALQRLQENSEYVQLLHGITGVISEMGELIGPLHKFIYYGGPKPDMVNVGEELGDALWFLSECVSALGLDLGTVAQANIEKLKKRYPEKFTTEQALNRDLSGEYETLKSFELRKGL